MTKPTVGVVLSGCGFLDGSEIHEAVCTLLFLDRAGATVRCYAPDVAQQHVVDHRRGEPAPGETRNVLVESARIARGKIEPLDRADPERLDALILPGGFGAAKNLSNFATAGGEAAARPELVALLRGMHQRGKPIGVVCIAPAVLAAALRGTSTHATLTIGDDAGTAEALERMGAVHRTCPVTEFVVDEANRIVSTPAYMYDARISEIAAGVEKLVTAVVEMCR